MVLYEIIPDWHNWGNQEKKKKLKLLFCSTWGVTVHWNVFDFNLLCYAVCNKIMRLSEWHWTDILASVSLDIWVLLVCACVLTVLRCYHTVSLLSSLPLGISVFLTASLSFINTNCNCFVCVMCLKSTFVGRLCNPLMGALIPFFLTCCNFQTGLFIRSVEMCAFCWLCLSKARSA